MLSYYLRYFDTVEINNSFYRLPTAECFCQWREATPEGFCFAVKASRFLTHFTASMMDRPAMRCWTSAATCTWSGSPVRGR